MKLNSFQFEQNDKSRKTWKKSMEIPSSPGAVEVSIIFHVLDELVLRDVFEHLLLRDEVVICNVRFN